MERRPKSTRREALARARRRVLEIRERLHRRKPDRVTRGRIVELKRLLGEAK